MKRKWLQQANFVLGAVLLAGLVFYWSTIWPYLVAAA
jgi:hypothetical protein